MNDRPSKMPAKRSHKKKEPPVVEPVADVPPIEAYEPPIPVSPEPKSNRNIIIAWSVVALLAAVYIAIAWVL